MQTSIKERSDLASYPQISMLLYHIVTVAQAGGMSEDRARMVYDEIHSHFINMQGEAFWLLREELIRMLVTPDESFDSSDGEGSDFSNRFN